MFKFLHAADLHLDSPLKGLERYDGAPLDELRPATRRALENLVALALEQGVKFVVIAGDIYDGDWPDYQTGLYFVRQMARLREAGIEVFLIAGNHDAANKMTKTLVLPENVRLLSHERPQTIAAEGCDAVIHGQSFANQAVVDNLACHYPKAHGGCFNLGLLHTCATGSDDHERYAPCSLDDLRSKQYDYWALGHIHQRQQLLEEPLVTFAGNVQGRHIREAGPKGCLLVSVDDRLRPTVEFQPLDVLRWELFSIDGRRLEHAQDLLAACGDLLRASLASAGQRSLAVRVEVRGPCPVHDDLAGKPHKWLNELRSLAIDLGGGQVWIEQLKIRTSRPRHVEVPGDGPIGELTLLLQELKADDGQLAILAEELDDLNRKLPPDLKEDLEALDLADPIWLRQMLEQVQPLLMDRLLGAGGEA